MTPAKPLLLPLVACLILCVHAHWQPPHGDPTLARDGSPPAARGDVISLRDGGDVTSHRDGSLPAARMLRRVHGSSSTSPDAAVVTRSIFVESNGAGNFTTIQEAIDSIPDGNTQWTRVHVAAGTYSEKVKIPQHKDFILLEGEGREQTIIQWDDHVVDGSPTDVTATFDCFATDFVARDITFKNTYDGINDTTLAVAAQFRGDRSAFYRCGFMGVQDTLSDLTGRHYYQDCYIEGAIDFVFGFGQSIYQGCTLRTIKVPAGKSPGFVTAQGRTIETSDGGFVFKDCSLDGITPVYLGRAWRELARVIFYRTSMSDVVVSQGWDAWHGKGKESQLTMVESECTGPGANRTGRVPWSRAASATDVARFINLTYISHDGWLEAQPH